MLEQQLGRSIKGEVGGDGEASLAGRDSGIAHEGAGGFADEVPVGDGAVAAVLRKDGVEMPRRFKQFHPKASAKKAGLGSGPLAELERQRIRTVFPPQKPCDIIVRFNMVGPEWYALLCGRINGHWKVVDVSQARRKF